MDHSASERTPFSTVAHPMHLPLSCHCACHCQFIPPQLPLLHSSQSVMAARSNRRGEFDLSRAHSSRGPLGFVRPDALRAAASGGMQTSVLSGRLGDRTCADTRERRTLAWHGCSRTRVPCLDRDAAALLCTVLCSLSFRMEWHGCTACAAAWSTPTRI